MGEHIWQLVDGIGILIAGMVINQMRRDLWPQLPRFTWGGLLTGSLIAALLVLVWNLSRVGRDDVSATTNLVAHIFIAAIAISVSGTAACMYLIHSLHRRVMAIEKHAASTNH